MAGQDHRYDIDMNVALCKTMDSELTRYIEELGEEIMELGAKKVEVEDVKRRLKEISMLYKDCKKEDAEILMKKLYALIDEYFKIQNSIHLDVGGPRQEKFNQSGESSGTQREGEYVFDMSSTDSKEESTNEQPKPKREGDPLKRMFDRIKDSYSSSDAQEDNDVEQKDDGLVHLSGDLEGIATLDEEMAQELRDILDLETKKSQDISRSESAK